eukprot:PITA_05387
MPALVHLNVLPLGSYIMILDMDWLYLHSTKVDCYDKDIKCLDDNGEKRILQGKNKPTSVRMITTMQAKGSHRKGCVLFVVHISSDKGKDVEDAYSRGEALASKAPYRMSTLELVELKLQLKEMLDKGYIRPDPDKEFVVCADSCKRVLGVVLMHEGKVVCYESKKLNEHEKDYAEHDLELAMIIHALKMWRHYLLGKRFILMSDHSGLRYLFEQLNLNSRQARWLATFSEFHFEIKYINGKDKTVVDSLSKRIS